jgi:hypothetical protein
MLCNLKFAVPQKFRVPPGIFAERGTASGVFVRWGDASMLTDPKETLR